ncbi:MAG: hypothetical protein ABEJ36_06215 [Candidatus Nanosalina sp.]
MSAAQDLEGPENTAEDSNPGREEDLSGVDAALEDLDELEKLEDEEGDLLDLDAEVSDWSSGEVFHWHDFDGAIYNQDLGEMIAENAEESYRLGMINPADFDVKVELVRNIENTDHWEAAADEYLREEYGENIHSMNQAAQEAGVDWDRMFPDADVNSYSDHIREFANRIEEDGKTPSAFSRASELGVMVNYLSHDVDLEEAAEIVNEAQEVGEMNQHIRRVVEYLAENHTIDTQEGEVIPFADVTAGIVADRDDVHIGSEYLLRDVLGEELYDSSIVIGTGVRPVMGTEIQEGENGLEVTEYNGREEKVPRMNQRLQELGYRGLEDVQGITVTDSGNSDGPMIQAAEESGAVGGSATDYATTDLRGHENYASEAVWEVMMTELMTSETPEKGVKKAYSAAAEIYDPEEMELTDIEVIDENAGEYTELAAEMYENFRAAAE